jgi:hypothetical protein
MARTRRLVFLSDRVFWGTHSYHLTPNRLFSWDCRTGSVTLEGAVRGPISDATADEWDRLYVSSSAESSEWPGVGQARILTAERSRQWREVARWLEADDLSGVGHAVLRFPQYAASDGRLLVSGFGVRGGDGVWLLEA